MKSETGMLVSQVNRMTLRMIDKLITESGPDAFSTAQGRILAILWGEGGILIQKLADCSGLVQNTLTSMVDRLEKNELCERRPYPQDRRKSRICLTEKGKSLRSVFEIVSEKMSDLYFGGFEESEIHQLDEILICLIQNFGKAM